MRNVTDHIVEGESANRQLTISVLDKPGQGGANHIHRIEGLDISKNAAYEACPDEQPGNYDGPQDAAWIIFQNGPIREFGVNGVTQDALAAIVIDRIRSFQSGPFNCEANERALECFCHGLHHFQTRTRERIVRGVEGTNRK